MSRFIVPKMAKGDALSEQNGSPDEGYGFVDWGLGHRPFGDDDWRKARALRRFSTGSGPAWAQGRAALSL